MYTVWSFNSIEWIPGLARLGGVGGGTLSIPLNGFLSITGRYPRLLHPRLSIPLNGFSSSYTWSTGTWAGLSIPLNGFLAGSVFVTAGTATHVFQFH